MRRAWWPAMLLLAARAGTGAHHAAPVAGFERRMEGLPGEGP